MDRPKRTTRMPHSSVLRNDLLDRARTAFADVSDEQMMGDSDAMVVALPLERRGDLPPGLEAKSLVRGVESAMRIPDYVRSALAHAQYDKLEDGQFFGEIPGFEGVWAAAPSREECGQELESVLRDWVSIRVEREMSLPAVPTDKWVTS